MKLVYSMTDQDIQSTKSMGILHVSLHLLEALSKCSGIDELHVLSNDSLDLSSLADKKHIHIHQRSVPKGMARVSWDQWGVVQAIRKIRPDWTIFPKGFIPFLPIYGRSATYIHDVMWRYYQTIPEYRHFFSLKERLYFHQSSLHSLRRSDLVLTSSEFNVFEFNKLYSHIPVSRIGMGFDKKEFDISLNPNRQDLLLYVSKWPHKLTGQALNWVARWVKDSQFLGHIYLLGSIPQGIILTNNEQWIPCGRLSDDEMHQLIAQKIAGGCFFSAYEGFGMPPVEMCLRGIPCLSSDIAPIRENIDSRLLFDNDNYQDFAEKMSTMMSGHLLFDAPHVISWDEVATSIITHIQ